MLTGKGVVAIWNDVADEGRELFYEWHNREHIPERLSIPGFLEGRRYRAIDDKTSPEFFTFYEVENFEVLRSEDYRTRLNNPTELTRKATSYFRNTSRALSNVEVSEGLGSGGVIATLRFRDTPDGIVDDMRRRLVSLCRQPLIAGVHLCTVNLDASTARTNESRERSDIGAPPSWFVLVEACTPNAVVGLFDCEPISKANALLGTYALELAQLQRNSKHNQR